MREIKFRQPLWDKHNKFAGWHYWGFVDDIFREPAGTPYSSMKEAKEQSQQYTGRKDKNDQEIYKGDILKDDSSDILIVRFGKLPLDKAGDCVCTYSAFYCEDKGGLGYAPTYECREIGDWMEVIGNIHENPNLLETKTK